MRRPFTNEQRAAAKLLTDSAEGLAFIEAFADILARKQSERGLTSLEQLDDEALGRMVEAATFEAALAVDPRRDEEALRRQISDARIAATLQAAANVTGEGSA